MEPLELAQEIFIRFADRLGHEWWNWNPVAAQAVAAANAFATIINEYPSSDPNDKPTAPDSSGTPQSPDQSQAQGSTPQKPVIAQSGDNPR